MSTQVDTMELQAYTPGFHMAENYVFKSERGLSRTVVEQISEMKGEPDWMRTVPPQEPGSLRETPNANLGR